jgi:hypothetical protein
VAPRRPTPAGRQPPRFPDRQPRRSPRGHRMARFPIVRWSVGCDTAARAVGGQFWTPITPLTWSELRAGLHAMAVVGCAFLADAMLWRQRPLCPPPHRQAADVQIFLLPSWDHGGGTNGLGSHRGPLGPRYVKSYPGRRYRRYGVAGPLARFRATRALYGARSVS